MIVLVLVNAAYLFQGSLTRADAYDWKSQGLQFLRSVPAPIPLPRVFVLGLDRSSQIQEDRGTIRGYNYVLGRLNTHGTWYAFPLMVLLKTPLALFGFLALATWRRRARSDVAPSDGAILLLPFVVVLAFFSLVAEPQLGIRYLLPGLPLMALYASASMVDPLGRRLRLAGIALGLWFAGSSLSYTPYPMSYFNELIGPRKGAWRYLADSNLDWEDRARAIDAYRRCTPTAPSCFRRASPRPAGCSSPRTTSSASAILSATAGYARTSRRWSTSATAICSSASPKRACAR